MDIKNKIVLITGGANGIGSVTATELLRNGAAHVAVLDLANSNGETTVSKLNEEFGKDKTIFVICDVTKPEQLEAAFAKTVNQFGGLDIVINNAGMLDDKQWDVMINVNYNGVINSTLLAFKYMGKDRGGKGGTIVNTASIAGFTCSNAFPIYTGTKHAIIGFSRSFGLPFHFEKTGVRVLTICPGVTDTILLTQAWQDDDRRLDNIDKEAVLLDSAGVVLQSPQCVAQGMVHVIRFGKSGSVWMVIEGKPAYEVQNLDFWMPENQQIRLEI